MSCRYCIGRHTIAAHWHARTIHEVVLANQDALGADRIKWYASDIREQVRFVEKIGGGELAGFDDLQVWRELANKLEQLSNEK